METKSSNILYIKNMVCARCIKVVTEELENLGINIQHIKLGEVEIKENIEEIDIETLKKNLQKEGFELIEDSKEKLVEAIKTEIISVIQKYKNEDLENIKFSHFLSEHFNKDYNYLTSLFSQKEGITIEKFIIFQKIEKAKELLRYGELTLSEIAFSLGYSSVQHLSRQFKKVTGLTASEFKNNLGDLRKPLDSVT